MDGEEEQEQGSSSGSKSIEMQIDKMMELVRNQDYKWNQTILFLSRILGKSLSFFILAKPRDRCGVMQYINTTCTPRYKGEGLTLGSGIIKLY